jgi:hypothetical protein
VGDSFSWDKIKKKLKKDFPEMGRKSRSLSFSHRKHKYIDKIYTSGERICGHRDDEEHPLTSSCHTRLSQQILMESMRCYAADFEHRGRVHEPRSAGDRQIWKRQGNG